MTEAHLVLVNHVDHGGESHNSELSHIWELAVIQQLLNAFHAGRHNLWHLQLSLLLMEQVAQHLGCLNSSFIVLREGHAEDRLQALQVLLIRDGTAGQRTEVQQWLLLLRDSLWDKQGFQRFEKLDKWL